MQSQHAELKYATMAALKLNCICEPGTQCHDVGASTAPAAVATKTFTHKHLVAIRNMQPQALAS
jgi:hypothetical protein